MSVTVRRFGVTSSRPAVLSTASNNLVLFEQPSPTTFTNQDLVMLPYGASGSGTADGYAALGSKAMSGMLLVPPYPGYIATYALYAVASGTITTPPSAIGASVNIVVSQNYFQYNLQQIQIISDPLTSLAIPAPLVASTTINWSMLVAMGGGQPVSGTYQITINNVLYSGVGISNRPQFDPSIIQLSIGMQFAGTVTAPDVFSATLSQFEFQQRP